MKSGAVLRKKSIAILAVLVLASVTVASLVALLVTTSPVYSVAQVRDGLLATPTSWLGRTVRIRALDSYPGAQMAWLVDPRDSYNPYSKGLPITAGQWQTPTFPRSLIWWLSSNVPALRGDRRRTCRRLSDHADQTAARRVFDLRSWVWLEPYDRRADSKTASVDVDALARTGLCILPMRDRDRV